MKYCFARIAGKTQHSWKLNCVLEREIQHNQETDKFHMLLNISVVHKDLELEDKRLPSH
jgi:hypothetical protein